MPDEKLTDRATEARRRVVGSAWKVVLAADEYVRDSENNYSSTKKHDLSEAVTAYRKALQDLGSTVLLEESRLPADTELPADQA